MPAARCQVRSALDFLEQTEVHLGWMLQIGVHHAEDFAARDLPAADHRSAQPAFALTPHDPNAWMALGEFGRDFPGSVRAVVVDDNQLERVAQHGLEQTFQLGQQSHDVLRFVERRYHERQLDSGPGRIADRRNRKLTRWRSNQADTRRGGAHGAGCSRFPVWRGSHANPSAANCLLKPPRANYGLLGPAAGAGEILQLGGLAALCFLEALGYDDDGRGLGHRVNRLPRPSQGVSS